MTTIKQTHTLIASTFLIVAVIFMNISTANAGGKAAVQSFYDLLSNPGSQPHADIFAANTADSWESIGNYSGKNKTKEMFMGQMKGFSKLIPDLKWEIQEKLRSGNQIVVRGRATGTPTGPLFGVDGRGKSFDILTIDIHTIENSKIVKSYHVEDWAGALQQLKTQ